MSFFTSAIDTLQILVVALGAGLGAWGVINLLEGYGNDNPGANSAGDLKPGHWPVFEKDEENSLCVTVADRAELMGTNYVPIFDLANGDLGVTLPGDKDKYQLSDGELTLDVR